jgi:hypothetical protein
VQAFDIQQPLFSLADANLAQDAAATLLDQREAAG